MKGLLRLQTDSRKLHKYKRYFREKFILLRICHQSIVESPQSLMHPQACEQLLVLGIFLDQAISAVDTLHGRYVLVQCTSIPWEFWSSRK